MRSRLAFLAPTARKLALAVSAPLIISSCQTADFLTDDCDTDFLRVTWPATITRGSNVTNATLFQSITPANIDAEEFRLLREVLINGSTSGSATVIWTVPAFDVNGGYIALTHSAPLDPSASQQVSFAFDGGGWGATTASRVIQPAIAVRADNFNATAASGTITTLNKAPLRLGIDITVRNALNQTMRITGEAQFEFQKVHSSCS
jgi:hypothetical protein